ncbi:MAG: hypothetical protein ACI808_003388 [Paraglaciecola sp.]|jgi:hypothetical protein
MYFGFSKFLFVVPITSLLFMIAGMSTLAAFEMEQAKLATTTEVKQAIKVFKDCTAFY